MDKENLKLTLDFVQMMLQRDGAIYSFQLRIDYCNMYGDCETIEGQRGRSEVIKTE
jgi:hypothetical protein